MSYFYPFCFWLLYFLFSLQINCSFSYDNASSISEDEKDPVYLITGGYRPGEHTLAKYVVSIRRKIRNYRYKLDFGVTHFCGGSILSPEFILTAAHCLTRNRRKYLPSSLEVITGTPKRLVKTQHTQIIGVRKTIMHRYYDYRNFANDIGLLQLKSKIILDGTFSEAIPLTQAPPVEGAGCVTLGWGRMYESGPIANDIVYVNITLVAKRKCRKIYPEFRKREICAFDPNHYERDSCEGDSGGPLICDGLLTGIVSYGDRCGEGEPAVYTDVYAFLDWINRSKSAKQRASLWILRLLIVFWTATTISS